jgi:hypothetical protein
MRVGAAKVAIVVPLFYLVGMLQRTLPAGFIAPCLPIKTSKLPYGGQWLHEIKHDGFRDGDVAALSRQVELALFCDGKIDVTKT